MKQLLLLSLLLMAPFAKGQGSRNADFQDGLPALQKIILNNFNVPESVKDSALSGRMYLDFRISTSGKVDSIMIIKNELNKDCELEALRVMRLIVENYSFIGGSVISSIRLPLVIKDGELVGV